jgi:hypothetical protein
MITITGSNRVFNVEAKVKVGAFRVYVDGIERVAITTGNETSEPIAGLSTGNHLLLIQVSGENSLYDPYHVEYSVIIKSDEGVFYKSKGTVDFPRGKNFKDILLEIKNS